MTAVEEFLAEVLPRQIETDTALQNGDAGARVAMWSDREPLSLFGAWITANGVADTRAAFEELASRFSDSESFEIEVVTAGVSGDLAYAVTYEHSRLLVDRKPTVFTIRVTHVYRREDGVWRLVHRHGDFPPTAPPRPDA